METSTAVLLVGVMAVGAYILTRPKAAPPPPPPPAKHQSEFGTIVNALVPLATTALTSYFNAAGK